MACTVGTIVKQICSMVGVLNVDTSQIDSISVRGFVTSGMFNAADAIRSLQRAFFFDMIEIDGMIVAIRRGAGIAATISKQDMVKGQEARLETAREQGVEFPIKMHIGYMSAESDYTPTKQTSERRSQDILAKSEISIDIPVNFTADSAAKTADIMHKIAWAEMEGSNEFAVSEKYAYLVASDLIEVEVSAGVYRRFRIQEVVYVDGIIQIKSVIDIESAFSSLVVAPPVVDPIAPGSNLPATTSYEIMDLPVLTQQDDTLHLYFAAHGDADGWTGSTIEQLVDGEWVDRGQITYPSTMGQSEEVFNGHVEGLDVTNTLLVSVSDDDIQSISETEFAVGGNSALIGNEIINFRDVVQEGDNYRLSHITRGALNTAPESHAIGERFVKLAGATASKLSSTLLGTTVVYRVYSFGRAPSETDEKNLTFAGNSQIEWEPLNATATLDGEYWQIAWEHNKRVGAPTQAVISQHFTGFEIELIDGASSVILNTDLETVTYTAAEQMADFGVLVTEFDTINIWGINEYTGRGDVATIEPELPYVPMAMTFDGASWYSGSQALTGNKATFVASFKIATFTGGIQYVCRLSAPGSITRSGLFISPSDDADAERQGKITLYCKDESDVVVCHAISTVVVTDNVEHVIFASYDGDSGQVTLIVDGVDVAFTGAVNWILTTGTLSNETTSNGVGGTFTGASLYTGDIGYFGFTPDYLTNWSDFMAGNVPKRIDEVLWTEWGSMPMFWNEYAQMDDNKGYGADFIVNGTITGPT